MEKQDLIEDHVEAFKGVERNGSPTYYKKLRKMLSEFYDDVYELSKYEAEKE